MSTIHLNKLLNPTSIVVIGASDREGAPGRAIAQSLISSGFEGTLTFVNPRYKTVLGQECFDSIKNIESPPDLVIILVPERIVRRTLIQTSGSGCKAVMVMSAVRKSKSLHELAQKLKIRMIGPYSAGIIRPHLKLNATYSNNKVLTGSLALVTQSASLGAAILDWAEPSGVGFSAVIPTGIDGDVSLPNLLDLLSEDYRTKAIIVYIDQVSEPRAFLSALSAAARTKPVVLMKSTQNASRYCDVLTGTGQVYSTEPVFQAAMRRAGVVRIRTFPNLFSSAKILTSGLRVKGNRIVIISNGVALAMLASEQLTSRGYTVPELPKENSAKLKRLLGRHWTGQNPITLRDNESLAEQYRHCLAHLHKTTDYDALLVLFAPDALSDPIEIANIIVEHRPQHIPVLTSLVGETSLQPAREILAAANMPHFRTPEAATDAFDFLHRYFVGQQELLQLPNPTSRYTRADAHGARKLIAQALADGDRVLGPQKTRTLMSLFDITVLPAKRVTSVEEAKSSAHSIGYPVAMKLVSPNVRFKSEVVGTILNIEDEEKLVSAYEHIEGSMYTIRPDAEFRGVLVEKMYAEKNTRNLAMSITRDTTFGPVINVSVGGDLSSLIHERATQLPPLNNFLIDNMLSTETIERYLGEYRHKASVGKKSAAHVLRRLSEMACELPDVFSVEINPLRVSSETAIVMDVQVTLERAKTDKEYSHLAIHPYPWRWIRLRQLKYGKTVQLRPIRPEDGESLQHMVQNMSAEAKYFRFMHAINNLSPQMIAQFTKLDYNRQMAFVAVSESGGGDVVGVSRYTISSDRLCAEFAVSISDNWTGHGLASALMKLVIEHATEQGIRKLVGDVLKSNTPMRGLMKSLGFEATVDPDDRELLLYSYPLQD